MVKHKEFAKRLSLAIDRHPHVPQINHGRLRWFTEQLGARGVSVREETVRKWAAGETMPRQKTLLALADALDADTAWLSLGRTPVDQRAARLRNAEADGVVNVLAGFIQMGGATPAFPGEGQDGEGMVDITAIIRGALYAFHVALARTVEGEFRFAIPVPALGSTVVLGVIPRSGFAIDVLELDERRVLAEAVRKGDHFEVMMDRSYRTNGQAWRQITTFSERI